MNPQVYKQLQNISVFSLLGISEETTSESEKQLFLTELESTIWEQVVEEELKEALTEEEMDTIDTILNNEETPVHKKRSAIVDFVHAKVPDIEEKLLHEAQVAKFNLLQERIDGLRVFYANNQEQINILNQAEDLVENEKVSEAIALLNQQQNQNQTSSI